MSNKATAHPIALATAITALVIAGLAIRENRSLRAEIDQLKSRPTAPSASTAAPTSNDNSTNLDATCSAFGGTIKISGGQPSCDLSARYEMRQLYRPAVIKGAVTNPVALAGGGGEIVGTGAELVGPDKDRMRCGHVEGQAECKGERLVCLQGTKSLVRVVRSVSRQMYLWNRYNCVL